MKRFTGTRFMKIYAAYIDMDGHEEILFRLVDTERWKMLDDIKSETDAILMIKRIREEEDRRAAHDL